MSKYLEMIRIRFLMMLAYRTNYYSGIIIYSINIGAYYFLWTAIYGGAGEIQGFSVEQMTTYVAVAWMGRAFYFNNIDREIANEIKDGKVAVEMIRPYNYLVMKLMQGLGEGLFRLLFFSLPGMAVMVVLLPIRLSGDLSTWGFFAVSLLFSFVVNTQINLLTGVMTFFLLNNIGLMRAKRVVVDLFSGLLIPLAFFPEKAQAVMAYLPFQAISYIPNMIFTGGFAGSEIYYGLGRQALWAIVLIAPVQLLWLTAKKHLVVQGG